jgi:hypothetical protein
MIYCLCPDMALQSAGFRVLYRHVQILKNGGIQASILHQTPGFRVPDAPPDVPVATGAISDIIRPHDILVFPEGIAPQHLAILMRFPVRRIIFAQSWSYVYRFLAEGPQLTDWRNYGIERAITNSTYIAEFIPWAMRLPTHLFSSSINSRLYYPTPGEKRPLIVYIKRKQEEIPLLMHLLWSRNPQYTQAIQWLALDGLPEVQYAAYVRQAQVFLNLSHAEAWPCALMEAMRSATLVAGWNSVGCKRDLVPTGPQQNGVFVENLDYPELARAIEPVLLDILRGDVSAWDPIRANALALSQIYNEEAETRSVLALWKSILGK